MTTEQILEKLHKICSSFPQIKFSDRDGKLDRTSNACFAYSCVKDAQVFVSFRLSTKDFLRALFAFGLFSFKWNIDEGIWMTVLIKDNANWTKLHRWIARSYQVVSNKPAIENNFSELLVNG
ncbi:hypothetical protein EYS14_17585 [Alteromonadaceae bacterium M269]|nr:hypothetical protein EYS14_17585 [Alteromonadaceae bacterium M269]